MEYVTQKHAETNKNSHESEDNTTNMNNIVKSRSDQSMSFENKSETGVNESHLHQKMSNTICDDDHLGKENENGNESCSLSTSMLKQLPAENDSHSKAPDGGWGWPVLIGCLYITVSVERREQVAGVGGEC